MLLRAENVKAISFVNNEIRTFSSGSLIQCVCFVKEGEEDAAEEEEAAEPEAVLELYLQEHFATLTV